MTDPRIILKSDLVPKLREIGFKGSFPHFRRSRENRNELITFQFDKYGTGDFVIEIASAPLGDFSTYWGKIIPQNKLRANDLNERLRIGASSHNADSWFNLGSNPNDVIMNILKLINTQGDDFFKKSTL
nr:DUF4304 domain-containing protein [uncultured Desulfobacter sp.]